MRLARIQLPIVAAVAGASLLPLRVAAGSAPGDALSDRASSQRVPLTALRRVAASGESPAERHGPSTAASPEQARTASDADNTARPSAAASPEQARTASDADNAPRPNAAASPEHREQARAIYEQGKRAYREGRFRAAIAHFVAADRQAPSAALSFNVARAYEKLDQPARALQHYREYRRREPSGTSADEVERRIERLEAGLAERGIQQLSVRSTPSGASLSVGGETLGSTPWTGELPLGSHQLVVKRAGYAAQRVTVHLNARAQQVQLELEPSPSSPTEATPASTPARGAASAGAQPWPWVSIGIGGAALAGAGLFELLRRDAESDAKHARYQPAYHQHRERMERQQTTARVLLGAGAVLVLGGGVWMLVDASHADHAERSPVVFNCQPSACIGVWKGTF